MAAKTKDDKLELQHAIEDLREIIQEYEASEKCNSLLALRLIEMNKDLLDEFFNISAETRKPIRKKQTEVKEKSPLQL